MTLLATIVGFIVSGSVGALAGLFIVGLIAVTGYLIALSVKVSETERNSES